MACCAGDSESVTCTVKVFVETAVGKPEMTPSAESKERPEGRIPLVITQVNGPIPPVTWIGTLYAVAVSAEESVVVAIDNGLGGPTVSVNGCWATCAVPLGGKRDESVACTVNPKVPCVVGVPEICPVVGAKLSPGGNDPVTIPQ